MIIFTKARLKVLSGFFANLAAGWFGAIVIHPNFSDLTELESKLVLTGDAFFVIVCLLLAFWCEERLIT